MTKLSDAQEAIKDLSTFLGSLRTSRAPKRIDINTARENLKKIEIQLETRPASESAELSSDESQATSIGDFFNAVGSGVRDAQETLDTQSFEYMRNRPSFAPETMFRMPKVSANLKLGMTYIEGKGFNFMVIKKSSETSQTIEQEISFDIVSAPPPPNTMEGFAELPIDPVLISSAVERDLVKQRLTAEKSVAANVGTDAGKVIGEMLKKDVFRRVLIFRDHERWTLMLISPAAERVPNKPNESTAFLLLPYEKGEDSPKALPFNRRMAHFYSLLFPIADKQDELLTALDRI